MTNLQEITTAPRERIAGRTRSWRRAAGRLVAPLLALAAAGAAAGDAHASATSGQFTVRCGFSHTKAVDPIVMPGMTGMGHSHDFFGNRSTNEKSTFSSLRAAPATSCDRTADGSAYWVPSLIQRGQIVQPENMRVYYRTGGITGTSIRAIPNGLKLVAGDARATAVTKQPIQIASWACTIFGGGDSGNEVEVQNIPATCNGAPLRVRIVLPQCWDGKNLDSPDHKSHMAYAVSRKCPATHPVILPQVTMTVRYWVKDTKDLTLASGGQHSIHSDLFAAWRPGEQEKLVKSCIHTGINCGETGTGATLKSTVATAAAPAPTRAVATSAPQTAANTRLLCTLPAGARTEQHYRRLS